MKVFTVCLIALLLSRLAFAGEATFGPEMEFRGIKQIPGMLCGGTLYASSYGTTKSLDPGQLKRIGLTTASLGAAGLGVFPIIEATATTGDATEKNPNLSATAKTLGAISLAFGGLAYTYAAHCPEIRHWSNKAYDAALRKRLKALCQDGHCRLIEVLTQPHWTDRYYSNYTLQYPDGFQIHFTHDPAVIEVKTTKMTVGQIEEHLSRLQNDVFGLLRKMGLKPPRLDGPWNGGQLHIGINEAFDDSLHVRNFIADLRNHPELVEGMLLKDPFEAPSWMADGGKRIQSLIDSIDLYLDFGTEEMKRKPTWMVQLFKKGSDAIVYNGKLETLELRFIRAQADAETLRKLAKLFQARINYLRQFKDKIPLKDLSLLPKTDPERVVAFRTYVEECGLSWADYETILPNRFMRAVGSAINDCMVFFEGLGK